MKPLSEIHVLIIDDEEFTRNMIHRIVDMIGVSKISEATDGADGLTKLQSDPPDVIILDIMMEPMNGLKFLKFLRVGMTGAPRELPVIVLTGSEEHAVLGKSMALDCNAFVKKPVPDQDALESRLKRVLSEVTELKNTDEYQFIKIPDVMPKSSGDAPNQDTSPAPAKSFEVPIEEVEAGAIVARDVVTDNGEVLLSAGTIISVSYLNRLCDIAEIIGLPSIWINA